MALKYIRLELARDHDFPNGSHERGYEFVAPLDGDGHLVAAEWKSHRERCKVKRFWGHDAAELGLLVHKPGGTWAFDYNPAATSDDEPGFKLEKHRFAPGEYVSFTEHDGKMRTFIVTNVDDLA